MGVATINYEDLIESSKFQNIHSIYLEIGEQLYKYELFDEEIIKDYFINALKVLVLNKICILKFREWVDIHQKLDSADLEIQLEYIYKSFPTEYDEKIPEKDIDNLWWYVGCPADIAWKQEDGSYWISG